MTLLIQLQLQLVIEGPVKCPKKVIFPVKNPSTDPGSHKQTKNRAFSHLTEWHKFWTMKKLWDFQVASKFYEQKKWKRKGLNESFHINSYVKIIKNFRNRLKYRKVKVHEHSFVIPKCNQSFLWHFDNKDVKDPKIRDPKIRDPKIQDTWSI